MLATVYDYGISVDYILYRDGSALRLFSGMEILKGDLKKNKCESDGKKKINS